MLIWSQYHPGWKKKGQMPAIISSTISPPIPHPKDCDATPIPHPQTHLQRAGDTRENNHINTAIQKPIFHLDLNRTNKPRDTHTHTPFWAREKHKKNQLLPDRKQYNRMVCPYGMPYKILFLKPGNDHSQTFYLTYLELLHFTRLDIPPKKFCEIS